MPIRFASLFILFFLCALGVSEDLAELPLTKRKISISVLKQLEKLSYPDAIELLKKENVRIFGWIPRSGPVIPSGIELSVEETIGLKEWVTKNQKHRRLHAIPAQTPFGLSAMATGDTLILTPMIPEPTTPEISHTWLHFQVRKLGEASVGGVKFPLYHQAVLHLLELKADEPEVPGPKATKEEKIFYNGRLVTRHLWHAQRDFSFLIEEMDILMLSHALSLKAGPQSHLEIAADKLKGTFSELGDRNNELLKILPEFCNLETRRLVTLLLIIEQGPAPFAQRLNEFAVQNMTPANYDAWKKTAGGQWVLQHLE